MVMEVDGVSANADELWNRIEDFLSAESLELDDLEVSGGGRGKVVKVVVDADRRVDVGRLARVSRGLSRLLDADDPIPGSYTLEVTSPGLERNLRRPAHFVKSIERIVKVKTTEEVDGATSHSGKIVSVDEVGFVVDVDGAARTISFDQVAKARTVFEWGPQPKPGRGSA